MGPGGGMPNVVAFPGQRVPSQVCFGRLELTRILDLFRRTADVPQMRLEKRPALHQRQGMWALFGEQGQVLKRGHDLVNVLAPLERRLLKVVEG